MASVMVGATTAVTARETRGPPSDMMAIVIVVDVEVL